MAKVQIRPLESQIDQFERLMAISGLATRHALYANAIELLIFYGAEIAQRHLVGIKDLGLDQFTPITIDDLWEGSKITVSGETRVADEFELPIEYRATLSALIDYVPNLATEALGDMFLLGIAFIERIVKEAALDRQIVAGDPQTATVYELNTPVLAHLFSTPAGTRH